MAVNFGLLQPAQPVSAFFQGQQDVRAEAERNALRQMQAEQMAMQRENMLAQRSDREALAAQRRAQDARAAQRQQFLTGAADALAKGGEKLDRPTLMKVLQSGVQADEPTLIQFAREGLKALEEEDLYRQEAARFGLPGATAPAAAAPSMMRQPAAAALPAAPAAPTNMLAGTPFDIGVTAPPRAAPVNALAAPPAAPSTTAPGVTREMVQSMLTSPSARIREQGKALVQTLEKPERPYEPTELEKLLNRQAQAAPGSPEARALQSRIDILTKREPKEPKEPSAPIAVVDEATGKVKYVSREEAIGKTPPSAMEGLPPKEIQKREASYPKTTAALRSFETQADTLVTNLTKLRDHPGLSGITGLIFGRTPAITAEARSAKADLDNILARGGFAELAAMRQASPTGGALGNISNQEVKYLRDAFGALDPVQDTETFKKKIDDVITQLQSSKRNVREEYDNTYEYRAQRAAAAGGAPRPPAGLSPEDKQALDWANSNPKDPRAAQIKQRLGM